MGSRSGGVLGWVAIDAVLLVPGGVYELPTELLSEADWDAITSRFGDSELANQ